MSTTERMFSTTKHVFFENSRLIITLLFETICFLKENSDLGISSLFIRAVHGVIEERVEGRLHWDEVKSPSF